MLVLISGPSGAGKSTLVHAWIAAEPRLRFSVSTTTRPIRKGEVEGTDYHFVDDVEFDRLVAEDAFVEWANVHKHRYGTRKEHVRAMIEDGLIPLLDVDVQGGKDVIDLYGDELVSIFVFPPTWDELERRLRTRGTDSDEVIRTRLDNARWEIDYACHYRYWVVNEEREEALKELQAILLAESRRATRCTHPLRG